jgi:CRP-like cAMP-binding protein
VGAVGVLDGSPRGLVATVREDAILARLSASAISELLERRNTLSLRMLELFNESLVASIRRTNMTAAHASTPFAASS